MTTKEKLAIRIEEVHKEHARNHAKDPFLRQCYPTAQAFALYICRGWAHSGQTVIQHDAEIKELIAIIEHVRNEQHS